MVFSTASGESEKVFSAASVVPWKSFAEHRAAGQIAVITSVNPIKPQAETGNKTTEAKNRDRYISNRLAGHRCRVTQKQMTEVREHSF